MVVLHQERRVGRGDPRCGLENQHRERPFDVEHGSRRITICPQADGGSHKIGGRSHRFEDEALLAEEKDSFRALRGGGKRGIEGAPGDVVNPQKRQGEAERHLALGCLLPYLERPTVPARDGQAGHLDPHGGLRNGAAQAPGEDFGRDVLPAHLGLEVHHRPAAPLPELLRRQQSTSSLPGDQPSQQDATPLGRNPQLRAVGGGHEGEAVHRHLAALAADLQPTGARPGEGADHRSAVHRKIGEERGGLPQILDVAGEEGEELDAQEAFEQAEKLRQLAQGAAETLLLTARRHVFKSLQQGQQGVACKVPGHALAGFHQIPDPHQEIDAFEHQGRIALDAGRGGGGRLGQRAPHAPFDEAGDVNQGIARRRAQPVVERPVQVAACPTALLDVVLAEIDRCLGEQAPGGCRDGPFALLQGVVTRTDKGLSGFAVPSRRAERLFVDPGAAVGRAGEVKADETEIEVVEMAGASHLLRFGVFSQRQLFVHCNDLPEQAGGLLEERFSLLPGEFRRLGAVAQGEIVCIDREGLRSLAAGHEPHRQLDEPESRVEPVSASFRQVREQGHQGPSEVVGVGGQEAPLSTLRAAAGRRFRAQYPAGVEGHEIAHLAGQMQPLVRHEVACAVQTQGEDRGEVAPGQRAAVALFEPRQLAPQETNRGRPILPAQERRSSGGSSASGRAPSSSSSWRGALRWIRRSRSSVSGKLPRSPSVRRRRS